MEPAFPADLAQALAHALLYDGKRRYDASRQFMAEIVAQHLVDALDRSGFVVMRKAPGLGHSSTDLGLRRD